MSEGEYTQGADVEGADDVPIIGADTEWTRNPRFKRTNDILAYGLVLVNGNKKYECYLEPKDSTKKSGRLSFKRALGEVLRGALQAGVIRCWPKRVIVGFHYGPGDLAAFSDFKIFRQHLTAVKGTLASGAVATKVDVELHEKSGIPCNELPALPNKLRVNATDQSGNQHQVQVRFVDSSNLTPANGRSLDKIGELIGFPKIVLPEGYSMADMRRFLEERPAEFRFYLLRDCLIVALFIQLCHGFFVQQLGLRGLPSTLGGAAVQYAQLLWKEQGLDRQDLLGVRTRKSRRYSRATGKITIVQEEVLSFVRSLTELVGATAFRGGWTENFLTGPVCAAPGRRLRDVDVKTAYPTAMVALGVINFDSARIVGPESLNEFTADALGIAEIEFRTPLHIRYPGIGLPTEAGLLFARNGRAVVTSVEIAAARSKGVDVEIVKGIILEWNRATRPFLDFVVSLQNQRERLKRDGRDTFESLMIKTIANSLYGKLGQGVHARSAYDPRTNKTRQLPPSAITLPLYAALTTALLRAAMFEMLNSIPARCIAVSLSTDGFLTDAELDEIDMSGPATQVLLEARRRIAVATGTPFSGGPSDVLEVKKEIREVLAFRTRGAATTAVVGDSKAVTAKANIKVPKAEDGNAFMARLYPDRHYDTRVERTDLICLRDQIQQNADLVAISRNPRVSLEPDMKRRLITGWDQVIQHGEHAGRIHLATISEPFDTVEDALLERCLFRQWRDKVKGCLKTEADWLSWQDHLAASKARRKGKGNVNVTADGSLGVAKRQFILALVRNAWGLSKGGRTADELARCLTASGFATSASDFKNASRKGNEPVEGCCGDTAEVRRFLAATAADFPGFESHRLFSAGGQPAAGGAF